MANLFKDEYVPNEEASTGHKKWVAANKGEAAKWATFRDAAIAHKKGDAPVAVPAMATAHGKALVAAGKEHMSVTDIGGVWDPVPPPPPVTGNLLFQATSESGNWANEWTSAANGSDGVGINGLVQTPLAEGGVTPREGSRMLKLYLSTANRASWSPSTLQSVVVQEDNIPNTQNGTDIYYGFSMYVSSGFQYLSSVAHVTFAEWHGTSQMEQAPIHFGVFGNGGNAGQLFLDLHRQASGYNPIFQQTLGYNINTWTAQWWNVVIRTKWSLNTDGAIQCWIKPSGTGVMTSTDLKLDRQNLATWNTAGASVKLISCIYRGIMSNPAWTYTDAIRVGDTLAIADPGSYS